MNKGDRKDWIKANAITRLREEYRAAIQLRITSNAAGYPSALEIDAVDVKDAPPNLPTSLATTHFNRPLNINGPKIYEEKDAAIEGAPLSEYQLSLVRIHFEFVAMML